VVVDADAAGQPSEGVVVGAKPGEGAGGTDALEGGIEPEGDADLGVDGGVPRAARAGADTVVKGGEVEARTEVPNEARLVVGIQEALQGHGGDDLLAVNRAQPRSRTLAHGATSPSPLDPLTFEYTESPFVHSL
jgi:hypothetical protein